MPRIIAIDYGTKRVGLAVTDELKIIATSLGTVHAKDVINYLKEYCTQNNVETFVVGLPKQMDGSASESERHIQAFFKCRKEEFSYDARGSLR